MEAIVIGIVAVAIGALLCFRGYVTMRLVISLFGAFAGFMLGVGLFGDTAGDGGQVASAGWPAWWARCSSGCWPISPTSWP